MRKILVLAGILMMTIAAMAQEYVLQGTIGTYPIVMHVSVSDNSVYGTYFYTSSLVDIGLDGGRMGPLYLLYQLSRNTKTGRQDTTELFVLKQNDNNTWSGGWKNNKGKKYDVALKQIETGKGKSDESYTNVRKSFFTHITDSTVKKGNYTLLYFHINKTQIYSFHITDGISRPLADKINRILDYDAGEQADGYFSCMSNTTSPEYDYTINSIYSTDNVMSVVCTIAYDCGGAHPDDYEHSINLNLKTGEEITLQDLLNLTASKAPPKNSDKWIDYISNEYGPKFMDLMKSLHGAQMAADTANDCDYSNADYWNFPDWYFTKDGIYIKPSFPHVIAMCGDPDWSTIPYDTLKKYTNPAKHISLP